MPNNQAPREPATKNQPVSFSAKLTSLAEKSHEAYKEALEDFRNAQTVGSPHYFLGRD